MSDKPSIFPLPDEPIARGIRAAPGQVSIQQALQAAVQHHAAGRLPQAEKILRDILQTQPQNAFALQLLGVIAHQSGQADLAIQLLNKAIERAPTVVQFHSNLAEMYRLKGQLDKAVVHGERAVALDANAAEAHSNLGIAYYDSKDYDKAEACQRQALEIMPTLPQAMNNLGSIRRAFKDQEGAIDCYRKVLENHPEFLESINNLGALLTEDERPEEAVEVLLRAVRLNPRYAEAHCNIAHAFLCMEQYDKARAGFNRALELKPEYPEALQGLAKLHQEQKDLPQAVTVAERCLAMAPERPEIHSLLGSIYSEQGYPGKAARAFNRALELDDGLVSGHLGKGHLLMDEGDLELAETCFQKALDLFPGGIGPRLALTQVKKVREDDENMAALVTEAGNLDSMLETKAISLHFALGKCYDDIKDYDRAFHHFNEGCRLKRKRIQYDAAENDKSCREIRAYYDQATIERLGNGGCPSDLPVFVLGMPRSGTTLTEQILASHPAVHGAGELPDLLGLANQPKGGETAGFPHTLTGFSREDFTTLGEKYVAGLRRRSATAHRITDKMPANYFCVGMIHLMLPNARIIHVKRNPIDTCLSGFSRHFNKTQYQSYDLAELGRYYRNYARLMDHWREVLPEGAFFEVQYEELVADNETQARRLIDYCGLEWDDACLDFHKTRRNVRTASVTQVRQPIYNTSVERWRRYEKHLQPLIEALGDVVNEQNQSA